MEREPRGHRGDSGDHCQGGGARGQRLDGEVGLALEGWWGMSVFAKFELWVEVGEMPDFNCCCCSFCSGVLDTCKTVVSSGFCGVEASAVAGLLETEGESSWTGCRWL